LKAGRAQNREMRWSGYEDKKEENELGFSE